MFPHSGDLVTAFLATLYLGALPSIFPYFNPQAPLDVYQGQVQKLVASAGARAVATSAALEHTLTPILAETGCEWWDSPGEAATSGYSAAPPVPRRRARNRVRAVLQRNDQLT